MKLPIVLVSIITINPQFLIITKNLPANNVGFIGE